MIAADFQAAAAAAGTAILFALLLRDWTISFWRMEFGPIIRRASDNRVWAVGAFSAGLLIFLLCLPAGLLFRYFGEASWLWLIVWPVASAVGVLLTMIPFQGWKRIFASYFLTSFAVCTGLHLYFGGIIGG